MTLFLRRWWQSWRDHQKTLASGVAHLEALDRAFGVSDEEALALRAGAWDALFGKFKREDEAVGHDGRCGLCGAPVDKTRTACPACRAVWQSGGGFERRRARLLFIAQWTALAVAGGWLASHALVAGLVLADRAGWTEDGWYGEFLAFLGTYLWFSFSVLIFLGATYRYERHYAETGRWRDAPPQ